MGSRFAASATAVLLGFALSLQAASPVLADPKPPAASHVVAVSKAKPRATVSATYVVQANGTVVLRTVSNAKKVQVRYRNAKNKKKSTTKKVKAGVAVAVLPAGARLIQVRGKATKQLRASAWTGASLATPPPAPVPAPPGPAPVVPPAPTPADPAPTPLPPADTTPPGPVHGLDAYPVLTRSLTVSWVNPPDADLATVIVSRGGVQVCATLAGECTEKGLEPDTPYTYSLVAMDRAGNRSTGVTYQVWTLATSATGAIQRVRLPEAYSLPFPASAPLWSPDGNSLSFQAGTADGLDVLWYDTDSGDYSLLNWDSAMQPRGAGGQSGAAPANLAWDPVGSRVAFVTDQQLAADDTNDCEDVYVSAPHGFGSAQRVSTKADGSQSTSCGRVYSVAWEHGGDDIAFVSEASDLVAGDTNGFPDVFVKTLSTGAVTRVSTTSDGQQAAPAVDLKGDWSIAWAPTGEKRLAFVSPSPNLVPADTNGRADVFVKTLSSGVVQRASTDQNGAQTSWPSNGVTWHPGGNDLAYTWWVDGEPQVLIKTLANGAIRRVTTSAGGDDAFGSAAAFSPDGSQVAFASEIDRDVLAPGWPEYGSQVYVKSVGAPFTVSRISADKDGEPGHAESWAPVWSPDGTKVAFVSIAGNLVPGDDENTSDIFIKTVG